MIDIPLRCGWRIVGTTERPSGIRVMDGDDVVDGVMSVDIHIDSHGFPQIQVALSPTKQSDTKPWLEYRCPLCAHTGSPCPTHDESNATT